MTRTDSILVCWGQASAKWELPIAPAGVEFCLLGWVTTPRPTDAGMPASVALILAEAFVSEAAVTYPKGTARQFSFVNTGRAQDLWRAFNQEYFDWTQRAQVLFLSSLNGPPPRLSEGHLRFAVEGRDLDDLRAVGVMGLVLPGVDGDVAGLYAFTRQFLDSLLQAIKQACAENAAEYRNVTEVEFAELLAKN